MKARNDPPTCKEELTIFDVLTRPESVLSTEEREEVKKVARELLERLKVLLVLGWRQKIQSRAKVRIAIEDALDEGLPRVYTKELFAKKSEVLSTFTRPMSETGRVSTREPGAARSDLSLKRPIQR